MYNTLRLTRAVGIGFAVTLMALPAISLVFPSSAFGADNFNEAPPGTLTVTKVVINDNGGTKGVSDFPLFVGEGGVTSGATNSYSAGTYTVSETGATGYVGTFSGDCNSSGQVTINDGDTKSCTLTNNDVAPPVPENSGKSQGGGTANDAVPVQPTSTEPIVTVTTTTIAIATTTTSTIPTVPTSTQPVVPAPVAPTSTMPVPPCIILEPEAVTITGNIQDLLTADGLQRDLARERLVTERAQAILSTETRLDVRTAIIGFVSYGTRMTYHLGLGERLGVIDSYRAIYGHLPVTVCDWQDVILMGSNRDPLMKVAARERSMEVVFERIYGRPAHRTQSADEYAIRLMSYGIRPNERDLRQEYLHALQFKGIMGHLPSNATEWDIVRAMTYGGVTR